MSQATSGVLPEYITSAERDLDRGSVANVTPEVYGGKAVRLLELQRAGFCVPPFLISPEDIDQAVAQLGTPLVVRSSATVEDGNELSFAGQFCSFLNLETAGEVSGAIEQCELSGRTASVVEYCRHHGVDPTAVRVAVIVQRMVRPELAGVAFTVNPATGDEHVVIEACAGVADELLAGRKAALPSGDPLLEQYRTSIESTALAIQRHFGAPQDVEFAIERGQLYVLQSRPITRIAFQPQIGVWTNADFRDGGVSSGVCSPLMWSLYESAWDRSLKGTLRELKLWNGEFVAARMFFGRPYWNLGAVKKCISTLPGFVERDFDNDLNVQATYDGDGMRTPVTVRSVLRAIPTVFATQLFFRRQLRLCRRFMAGGFEKMVQHYEPIGEDAEGKFRQLVQQEFLTTETIYFRTIFAASLAKLDLLTTFPQASDQSLLASLPPLRHMGPLRLVQALQSRDADSLAHIVTKFRHHYRQGLDICFPRWDEDRAFVIRMLQELPSLATTNTRCHYESALSSVQSRIPKWRRRSFLKKLQRLRAFLWLREEMRDFSSQMYYLIRRYALQLSRQRRLGDDIFFMTFHEILVDDRSNIEPSRTIYESYRNFNAPNEIGLRCGCPDEARPNDLRGLAAGAGLAEGAAFVAHNVAEAAQIDRGQILVCPFTDPGWTPVLCRAAGVVAETGGLLSHAAVICREFGIPAVLGVSGATRRIRHGQLIRVDGTLGSVQLAASRTERNDEDEVVSNSNWLLGIQPAVHN
jgi:phosphohistidine swiveling domain-containing protein